MSPCNCTCDGLAAELLVAVEASHVVGTTEDQGIARRLRESVLGKVAENRRLAELEAEAPAAPKKAAKAPAAKKAAAPKKAETPAPDAEHDPED